MRFRVLWVLVWLLAFGAGSDLGAGWPAGGQRRGGPARVLSDAVRRIESRTYLFRETNERLEYAVFVSTKVDRTTKSPLVIGLHGAGSVPSFWLSRVADAAEDAGYIVAAPMGYNRIGWYGANGRSSGVRSPANLGELSERDVMNVLALVRQEFSVDEHRIYLAGHSMGGAGALYLGIKHKDIWAAVAASSPAVVRNLHTTEDLRQAVDLPVLLIHGDKDEAVPVSMSRAWAAKMNDLKMTYEFREIRGANHLETLEKSGPFLFAFFDRHVKP